MSPLIRREHQLGVRQGTLEEIRFPEKTFDAVTMNHVIEHLPDPSGTLQEVKRILKDGGRLVLTTTHTQSWGHRCFQQDWIGLDFPRHLYMHTMKSLKRLVQQAGFEVVFLRTSARGAAYFLAMSHLLRQARLRGGKGPHACLLRRAWVCLPLPALYQVGESLILWRNKLDGEEIVLSVKKEQ